MEQERFEVLYHTNRWWWGESVDIVKSDGKAIVCVKFDEKSFQKTGYICNLSVCEEERRKGYGWVMMMHAIAACRNNSMNFAQLHVDAQNEWLIEWYEKLGFKELSRDENEIELIREL